MFFQPRLPRGCGETTRPSRGGGAASKIASGGGVTLRTKGGFDDGEGAGAAAAAASAALDARSVALLPRAVLRGFGVRRRPRVVEGESE